MTDDTFSKHLFDLGVAMMRATNLDAGNVLDVPASSPKLVDDNSLQSRPLPKPTVIVVDDSVLVAQLMHAFQHGGLSLYRDGHHLKLVSNLDIVVEPTPIGWQAVDQNSYDGAPDSGSNQMGTGSTQREAVVELLEQLAAVL